MAKKKPAKTEIKSEFLRKALGRNPNLDHRQVNQRWTKAGHTGDISNALFYQVRAKLGIKTEWVWVKESESEVESMPTEVTGTVYQIKITLLDTQPPVWRRIQVPILGPVRSGTNGRQLVLLYRVAIETQAV